MEGGLLSGCAFWKAADATESLGVVSLHHCISPNSNENKCIVNLRLETGQDACVKRIGIK